MKHQDPFHDKPRHPWISAALSLAATGLGHIYCGKIEKGLVLFFLSFIFAPVIASFISNGPSGISLWAVIGSVIILVLVYIYAVIDSVVIAKKTPPAYALKEYNRWYIYLVFIVVSFTYPTNLAHTLRDNVVQAYKIPTESMVPGILKRDFVLLNKAVYRKRSPKIGDVVVFTHPNQRHLDYIKRIVAMPGDSIEIKDNVLYINDKALEYRDPEPEALNTLGDQATGTVRIEVNGSARYGIMLAPGKTSVSDTEKTTIPNGYCYVLGDNRSNSQDSRAFGPVPLSDIKGRVIAIYLPAESWSRFGQYKDLQ